MMEGLSVTPNPKGKVKAMERNINEADVHIAKAFVQLMELKEKVAQLKEDYEDRASRLSKNQRGYKSVRSRLEGQVEGFKSIDAERLSVQYALCARRSAMVRSLRTLFPISVQPPSQSDAAPMRTIREFVLPPVNILNRQDPRVEEDVATALGMFCQALVLWQKYVDIPTNQILTPCSSRSYIKQLDTEATFPLYYKGLDRFKFDTALKDLTYILKQLLRSQGHGMLSENDLLGSAKPLFEIMFHYEFNCQNYEENKNSS